MKVLISGASGFLGCRVVDQLKKDNHKIKTFRSVETDLIKYDQTIALVASYKPDVVIHLAAKVGGIGANMANPADFCYSNLIMGANLIEASRVVGVDRFVMVGTVCSYPKFCSVPFNENDLWNGFPEETNAPYGIAKKTLGVMLKAYYDQYNLKSIVLMPCNLYGPGDNFDDKSSHVIPALIKKFVYAKQNGLKSVHCWGDGSATREFLHVDDAARAIAMSIDSCGGAEVINLGSSGEISIRGLAEMIKSIVGFDGEIIWDDSMPNGQPRRLLDTTKAKNMLGWQPSIKFHDGLVDTVNWWVNIQKQGEMV